MRGISTGSRGLLYGDNPEQGIVRGKDFLHPALRFALAFPEGWEVQNSAELVVAKEPGRDNYMVLQLVEDRGRDLQRTAETDMEGAGFRMVQGSQTTINGLDAFVGTYTQDVNDLGQIIARVAHIRSDIDVHARRVWPADNYTLIERPVHDSIHSFRQLTRDEADQIRPTASRCTRFGMAIRGSASPSERAKRSFWRRRSPS